MMLRIFRGKIRVYRRGKILTCLVLIVFLTSLVWATVSFTQSRLWNKTGRFAGNIAESIVPSKLSPSATSFVTKDPGKGFRKAIQLALFWGTVAIIMQGMIIVLFVPAYIIVWYTNRCSLCGTTLAQRPFDLKKCPQCNSWFGQKIDERLLKPRIKNGHQTNITSRVNSFSSRYFLSQAYGWAPKTRGHMMLHAAWHALRKNQPKKVTLWANSAKSSSFYLEDPTTGRRVQFMIWPDGLVGRKNRVTFLRRLGSKYSEVTQFVFIEPKRGSVITFIKRPHQIEWHGIRKKKGYCDYLIVRFF